MALVLKKFGAIGFFVGLIGFSIALYLGRSLNFGTQELVGWGVMGMTSAIVYFGVAYQRDTVNAGKITFGQALKTGLVIAAVGALGVALADMVYTIFVNPDFFMQYDEYATALAQESKSQEQLAQLEAQKELYATYNGIQISLFAGIMMFIMTFMLGLIVSFISAFILKRD